MSLRTHLAAAFLVVSLGACAHVQRPASAPNAAAVTAAMHDDPARPADSAAWLRSELYFGTSSLNGEQGAVDDTRWRAFLDTEVTPRFPDGLTVLDGYGQWLFRGNPEPERLGTKILVVLHEDTPQRTADIEAIRLAWKQATGHQSVLWSRQPVVVSF